MMLDRERPAVYHASPHVTTEDTSAPQEDNKEEPPTRHQGARAARPEEGPGRGGPASPGGRGRDAGGGTAPRGPDHHSRRAYLCRPHVTRAAGSAVSLGPSRDLLRCREHEPRRPY